MNRRGYESLGRAIEFFEAAIARDPMYALADLGLAEAYGLIGFHEFQLPREAFPRARAAAERALAILPGLGEAYAALGYVALHHDRDWDAAERAYLRAIELNPDHAVTRLWYANLLLAEARFDEALEQGRRALELDPLSIILNLVTGWIHFFERRFEAAYEKMVRALAAAFAGRGEEGREMVHRMIAMRSERYVSAFYIALGFVAAGDTDQAEPWIERAAEERSPRINFLNVDPRVSALHGRPRIQAIQARLGRGA